MTFHTVPWAMQALSHNAELVRQAHQAHLIATGVGTGAVSLGDLAVTALGTPNMSVNVAAGSVFVPGSQGSTTGWATNPGGQPTTYGANLIASLTSQGSYYGYNDATVNLTISAANATNPRIDVVCVSVQDAAYSGSTNTAVLQVITGTPASSPAVPSLPVNSVALAQVYVGANVTSITSGNITDVRPIVGAQGGGIRPGTSVIVGSVPTATTRMISQTFAVTPTFSSSLATVSFPVAFANGVQSVQVTIGDSASARFVANVNSATTLSSTQVAIWTTAGGAFSGTATVNITAVGW